MKGVTDKTVEAGPSDIRISEDGHFLLLEILLPDGLRKIKLTRRTLDEFLRSQSLAQDILKRLSSPTVVSLSNDLLVSEKNKLCFDITRGAVSKITLKTTNENPR